MSKQNKMVGHRIYEVETEAISEDTPSPRYTVLLFDEPVKLSRKRVDGTNSITT